MNRHLGELNYGLMLALQSGLADILWTGNCGGGWLFHGVQEAPELEWV